MSFSKASGYLDKYKSITPPDEYIREYLVLILKKQCQINVFKKDISCEKGVIYIKTNPLYKNEIFIKKDILLKDIKENIEGKIIKDIR